MSFRHIPSDIPVQQFRNGPPVPQPGSLPDPDSIARQKEVYLTMLDEQLKQGMSVLDQQVKYQRDYLQVQCEQQKKQFLLQLDQQMKAQDMKLTQQYNEQLMVLQLQAGHQKAALEQQAMQLSMEYEQRKAEESMYRQQYDIQRQQMEMASRLAEEYHRMGPLGSPSPSYAPPPAHVAPGDPRSGGYPSWAPSPMEPRSLSYLPPVVAEPPPLSYRRPPVMASGLAPARSYAADSRVMASGLAPAVSYSADTGMPMSYRHMQRAPCAEPLRPNVASIPA